MMLKKISLVLGISTILYGCNTMEGMGTDIKEAGKSLESTAERNKGACSYQ